MLEQGTNTNEHTSNEQHIHERANNEQTSNEQTSTEQHSIEATSNEATGTENNDTVSHSKNESQNECIKHEMQIITSNAAQKRKNKKQHRKSTEQLEHPTVEGEANTTCETFTMLRGVINNELYDRIEKLTRIVNKASEESKQHPNDKSRADSDSAVQADYLEMTLSKHVNAMQEAYTQYKIYKATSTEHNDNIDICDELFKCLFVHGKMHKSKH
jgi:hypothetical protein